MNSLARGLFAILLLASGTFVFAHDLSADNAAFVKNLSGAAAGPFLYLGAKHMFTGYDHLLFLLGVIFFLYRPQHILLYVSLFTLGHSVTLFLGVYADWQVSSHLVDAVIGLSVVYKAFENLRGFETLLGWQPDSRVAVLIFGLFHGLGLATKLQEYIQSGDGLLTNLLSFNLGVELGQLAALVFLLLLLQVWRNSEAFGRQAFAVNSMLMCAGFVLFGMQLTGYMLS